MVLIMACVGVAGWAADLGPTDNSSRVFRSTRYEQTFTRVPSTGQLVGVKVADNGRMYYICKEKTGYVIYHQEIRPATEFKDKIEQEMKDWSRKWDNVNPDELVFTKERYYDELKKRVHRYSDLVWVRNEIVVEPPGKPQARTDERHEKP